MGCKGDADDRLKGGGGGGGGSGRLRQSKGEDAREEAAAVGDDALAEAKCDFSGVAEEKRSPCAAPKQG